MKYKKTNDTFIGNVHVLMESCAFNITILDEILEGVTKRGVSFKRPNIDVLRASTADSALCSNLININRAFCDVCVLHRELDELETVFIGRSKPHKKNLELLKEMTKNAVIGVRCSLTDLFDECTKLIA